GSYDTINNSVSILLNNGDGTFADKIDYATSTATRVVQTDLTGDGRPDMLAINDASGYYYSANNTVRVLINNGDGTFAPPVVYDTPHVSSIVSVELDGDNRPDLIGLQQGYYT